MELLPVMVETTLNMTFIFSHPAVRTNLFGRELFQRNEMRKQKGVSFEVQSIDFGQYKKDWDH